MKAFKNSLISLACVVAATAASAATVQIKFDNDIFSGMGYDAVHINFALQSSVGTKTEYVAAGRFEGTATNLNGIAPSIFSNGVNDVYMYCYDVYEDISGGQKVTYTVNLNGETARTLDFIGAVNSVMNGSKVFGDVGYDNFAWLHPMNQNQGAAIQLGIWKSKYDTSSWAMNSGAFRAWDLDQGTSGYLAAYMNAINTTASIDGKYVMVLEASGAQDMITGDPPPNTVPEPGSLALIGAALVALAATRRQRAM